jgi:hypothetical protein
VCYTCHEHGDLSEIHLYIMVLPGESVHTPEPPAAKFVQQLHEVPPPHAAWLGFNPLLFSK